MQAKKNKPHFLNQIKPLKMTKTKKYFEVQRLLKTVTRVTVEAKNKDEAIKIANSNDLFSEAKEEVLNEYHKAGMLDKKPEGRIIHTKDGHIKI
jgi:hypothetical protein